MPSPDLPAFKLAIEHLIDDFGELHLQSEEDFLVVDWFPTGKWHWVATVLVVKIPWIDLRQDPKTAAAQVADKITDHVARCILTHE